MLVEPQDHPTMSRKKVIILPKLYDYDGDLSKKWFVFYSYRDPASGKMNRFKVYDGISEKNTIVTRTNQANKIIEEFTKKILNGWTPYQDSSMVIYSDNLKYHKATENYSRIRKSNKKFNYYINMYMDNLNGVRPSTYTTYKSKFRYFSDSKIYSLENMITPMEVIEMNNVYFSDMQCDFVPYYLTRGSRIFPLWVELERVQ